MNQAKLKEMATPYFIQITQRADQMYCHILEIRIHKILITFRHFHFLKCETATTAITVTSPSVVLTCITQH
jgi:hypothetical protein